jgi:hypothetical protein
VVRYDEIMNPDYYEKLNRVEMRHLQAWEGLASFGEINQGYAREEAVRGGQPVFPLWSLCRRRVRGRFVHWTWVTAMADNGRLSEGMLGGGCRIMSAVRSLRILFHARIRIFTGNFDAP